MSKRSFEKGDRITSVDELLEQDMVIFSCGGFKKVYSKGWFISWQLNYVSRLLEYGNLYKIKIVTE